MTHTTEGINEWSIEAERAAQNIVYQLDDDSELSVDFRQANNDNRIDFTAKVIQTTLDQHTAQIVERLKKMQEGLNTYNRDENGIAGVCNPRCHDEWRKRALDQAIDIAKDNK